MFNRKPDDKRMAELRAILAQIQGQLVAEYRAVHERVIASAKTVEASLDEVRRIAMSLEARVARLEKERVGGATRDGPGDA